MKSSMPEFQELEKPKTRLTDSMLQFLKIKGKEDPLMFRKGTEFPDVENPEEDPIQEL